MMQEFGRVVWRGLSYEGSLRDVVINYALIVLVVLPYVFVRNRAGGPGGWGWAVCLVVALVVQVLLWFVVQATGVSIIWSALAGFLLTDILRVGLSEAQPNSVLVLLALACTGAGIVYYALTFPPITTVAHLCAVLLGLAVWFVLR